ncbi:MAG: hypothetical protein CMM24_03650 [Rhodospirillaceae bacterium]|nr:hypothetical protein [Rhodospirillaceae bacterium]
MEIYLVDERGQSFEPNNNISIPDECYDDFLQALNGFSANQCRQLNSRIILLMGNQIADNRSPTNL